MNKKSIAVIDSGIGGLHILETLVKEFPNENFIFFADEDFFPYGIKEKLDLANRLTKILNRLLLLNIKALVIACNTASAVSSHLKELTNIPIIEIIKATSEFAVKTSINKKIGVWATNGTISYGTYQKYLTEEAKCFPVPASDLVIFIENNQIRTEKCIASVKQYLNDICDADSLILGCTHFPLLTDVIKTINPNLQLISSNIPVCETLLKCLNENKIANDLDNTQKVILYSSSKNLTLKEKVTRFNIVFDEILYLDI